MVRYWIHATTVNHWEEEIARKTFMMGLGNYDVSRAKRVKQGDKVAIYLVRRPRPSDPRVKHLSGLFQVASQIMHDRSKRWSGGLYPVRLKLFPIILARNAEGMVPIESLVDDLSFIKNKQKWGRYLQSSLIPISEEDYELIKNELECRVL